MFWQAQEKRYDNMIYRRCGKSGLMLPILSLGLWQNFGDEAPYSASREMVLRAFDQGITHFDLANNYGLPAGSAEIFMGRILSEELRCYRDELVISTKAGHMMWPGPYGAWNSRKSFLASLDQSLKRMKLDYVDIFYSHRFDPDTPLEETMMALDHIVRQGKALYVGISQYPTEMSIRAAEILQSLGTPCLIHQPSASLLDRWVERTGLLDVLEEKGIGCIVFSPLAQGVLSKKYLDNIPSNSRIGQERTSLSKDSLRGDVLNAIRALDEIANRRGQTLPQMAISWLLRDQRITSVLLGVRTMKQLNDNLASLGNIEFHSDELEEIEKYAVDGLLKR